MPLPKETSASVPAFRPVEKGGGERILLYGPTKIGKTSLALRLPGKTVFLDLDDSLPKLDVPASVQVMPVSTYDELYAGLNANIWDDIDNVVIDSMTVLTMMAMNKVLKQHNKSTLQEISWGQGQRLVYDCLDKVVQALENHKRAGRNTCVICHTHTGYKPNAGGDDFLSYSPDLFETSKMSFKERLKGWADHVLFINYDVHVNDGKGQGSGSRTIYTKELPYMTAGSRTIKRDAIPYTEGSDEIWRLIFSDEPGTTPTTKPTPATGNTKG